MNEDAYVHTYIHTYTHAQKKRKVHTSFLVDADLYDAFLQAAPRRAGSRIIEDFMRDYIETRSRERNQEVLDVFQGKPKEVIVNDVPYAKGRPMK